MVLHFIATAGVLVNKVFWCYILKVSDIDLYRKCSVGMTQKLKHFQAHIVEKYLILFSSLSDDRSKASSKTIPPHSAIQSLLFQMRVSSPVLKVIQ